MQLQNAEKNHKIKEMEWKRQQAKFLQSEQEKFDKRLNGFHQRMIAKDEEFARILMEERQTKSAPSSPTSSTFLTGRRQAKVMVTQEQYNNDIQQLKDQIKELVNKHQMEIEKLQQEKAQEMEQLQITHTAQLNQQLAAAAASRDTSQQHDNQKNLLALVNSLEAEKRTFDALKSQMDLDRTREFNLHQELIQQLKTELEETRGNHRSKILQMNEKHSANEARLKSLYMNENQQLTMHCEAHVANLVAEHENIIKELKENLENEKEVLQIKHHTVLEEERAKWAEESQKNWEAKRNVLEKEKQALVEKVDFTLQQKEQLRIDYAKYKKEAGPKLRESSNVSSILPTNARDAFVSLTMDCLLA